ncbi:helix-turn-helix domain-containing protein [Thermococcus sp.]|uniref:helix-turn-helix domain-containing protein n=1 Tax=Thermococcus sp. TaxID=35749 RepID=UPI0025DD3323|nr:helix-turn-helix domain-containing protein [Thermococcus sp.]
MGKLERVLDLITAGERNPAEIAKKLGMSRDEVEGVIKILESMGYVERIEKGGSACETCPLKSICPGSCVQKTGTIYKITKKSFSLKRGHI